MNCRTDGLSRRFDPNGPLDHRNRVFAVMRMREELHERLAALDTISQTDQHFEARRKIDLVAEHFAAAAELDDGKPKLLRINGRHLTCVQTQNFGRGSDGPGSIEVAALGSDHLYEFLQGPAAGDVSVDELLR